MERYWQNTWQYKRILEILDDYWITEKDETFVQIVMHFKKGDKEKHKTIVWFNPKLIPDIDADPDIPSLDEIPARHGKWETSRPDAPMFGFYYCSLCGRKRTSPQDRYCPNCGARMDEE